MERKTSQRSAFEHLVSRGLWSDGFDAAEPPAPAPAPMVPGLSILNSGRRVADELVLKRFKYSRHIEIIACPRSLQTQLSPKL